jgi:hypothetical protein
MAGGGQDLGSATFRVTLDDSDLRNKLKQLKTDIEALKVGPVKLNADGTGTRSKTNTGDAAKNKDAAAEARRQNALQTLESKRFRIARQINQLEERGVNVDRLRSKLEKDRFSTGTKSSLAQLQAANQTTRQLSRQVALSKDLADKNKRAATAAKTTDTPATSAPAKEPRQPARGIDRSPLQGSVREVGSPAFGTRGARMGGASESITAKTDAQSRRARLNQQLNSLEASGVKTTKLRAQLGEATTAQANRQFGTFNQIADSLEGSLRSERAKLKIQKDQTRELEKQDKEGRRLGRENKSPVRGGVGFGESPAAKAARNKELNRIARDNAEPIRGNVNDINTPAGKAARNKQLNRIAKENASPVRGGIGFDKSPIAKEIAARKQERLAKDLDAGAMERAANRRAKIVDRIDYLSTGGRDQSVRSAAAPLKPNADAIKVEQRLGKAREATAASTTKELNRIAKDNAQPIGGTKRNKDSPAFKAAEEERTRLRIERRARKISDRQDYFATGGRDQPSLSSMAVPSARDPAARTRARQKAAADKQRKQEQGARLNSGLVGGAFPLMFGQGGFAAVGGAIGGTAGGGPLGFGLSLVGTLVGSQIDELSNRFISLSKALQDPIKSFDVFIEQASLASTAQEKLAQTLIDKGQLGRAESLISDELSRTLEPAVASRVEANTDNFNRALSDTKDVLGQIVAGPASEFLNFLSGVLSIINEEDTNLKPNATPEQRQQKTIERANERKVPAQVLGSVSSALIGPALSGILTAALTSGEEKDIRVAKSKEVFALEKKLSKEKKTQQQIEEATLTAQSQGLEDTAKQLSLQAKLAGVTVKETKANKGAAEELERSKFFGFGSGDTKKAEAKRKDIKETADLERKSLLAEQAGEKRSSDIQLSNAQRLRGLEGPARDIQTKKNSVSEAQREANSAQQIKNQRISDSTGSPKDKALITAASDAATTANNKLNLSKLELNETTERAIKLAGRELDLAKSAVNGDRIGSLNKQINFAEEDRNFSLRKLGPGATRQEKEAVNLSADAKVLELQQQKKQLQNDLNQSLQSELIIRQGIAKQITAAVAQQEAALARGDSAANPGNSVLAARAGGAEGRAFLAQNNLGVDAARRAEADIQSAIKFEVDPNKIAELQSKLQTASQATKLAMVEAGTALANKAADAAASLQGARDGLRGALDGKRGLLESNINKLPVEQQASLKQNALADVRRGVDTGILRPDIKVNNTASLLSNANFVRQVEAANKQIAAAEAQISALNANTEALRQGGAIAVSVYPNSAGGWSPGTAERTAA